jgi:hypothetical protein
MAEVIGLQVLGLVIGALFVRAVQARRERRIAHLVRLFAPYRAAGTTAPTDITASCLTTAVSTRKHN